MMKTTPIFVLIVAIFVSSTAMLIQPMHGYDMYSMFVGMDETGGGNGTTTTGNDNGTNIDMVVIEGVQMNINGTTNRTILMTINTTAIGNNNLTNLDNLLQLFQQEIKVCAIGANESTNGTTKLTYSGTNLTHLDTIVIVAFQMNENETTNRTIVLNTTITVNGSIDETHMDDLDDVMGSFKQQLECFYQGGNWSTNGTEDAVNCTLSSNNSTNLDTVLIMVLHMSTNGSINTTITATTNITNSGNSSADLRRLHDAFQAFKDQITYFHEHQNLSTQYNSSSNNDTDVYPLDSVLIAGFQIGKNSTAQKSFIVITNTTNGNLNAKDMNDLLETFKEQLNTSNGSNVTTSSYADKQNCSSVSHLQPVLQVNCQLIQRFDLARNGTNNATKNDTNVHTLSGIMKALGELNGALLLGFNRTTILPAAVPTSLTA